MVKRKVLSFALAGTLGFTTLAAPMLAAEAAPETATDFESLLSELTVEQDEAANKLADLEKELAENEAKAEALMTEMQETTDLLEKLNAEIEELKIVIELREAQLEDQARALQIVGESGNLVKFVLDAESLNDVVGRIDVVSTLVSSNKKNVTQQKEDKASLEAKEKETAEKQEEQAKIAGKLETNKNALEERQAEQESLLAEIASEKAIAKEERDALIAQAKEAEQRRQDLEAARMVTVASATNERAVSTLSSSAAADETTSSNATDDSTSGQTDITEKTETPTTPAPPAANGGSVVGIAHSLAGVPYLYGGTTPAAFDCSGYTSYVFQQAGRSLPRTTGGQYAATARVSQSEAQPGDLVFFSQGGGIDHVGIYLGGGSFIGAQTSTGVAVSTINSGYWANYVVGFGR